MSRQWIPYDDRLDRYDGYAGTQGDFAQRAMRHFAEHVVPLPGDVRVHHAIVADAMSTGAVPERPFRDRKSDDEVVKLIMESWDEVGGRSGEMLRHLRRGLNIA